MGKVLVEISARHVHLSDADVAVLFGSGHTLTPKKTLSQPGQFASEERVDIVGPKKTLSGVSVLGPTRAATQVEISLTDARTIGMTIPIRESGDIDGTPGCKLVGPAGELELQKGVIAAQRHIHLDPETAAEFGVKERDIVSVRMDCAGRKLVFGDVVIRVSDKFNPAMHIDTDEGNAADVRGECFGDIVR